MAGRAREFTMNPQAVIQVHETSPDVMALAPTPAVRGFFRNAHTLSRARRIGGHK